MTSCGTEALGASPSDNGILWSRCSALMRLMDGRHSTDEEARHATLYLVFKVSLRLSERWQVRLNGGRNLMGLLVDGAKFEDGCLGRAAGENGRS